MQTKVCRRCNKSLSASEFGKNSSARDGLSPYCLACWREYERQRRASRPDVREREREYQRQRRETVPDAHREAVRRHRERYPERHLETSRRWKDRNKDRHADYWRDYYKQNAERSRWQAAERAKLNPERNRFYAKRRKLRMRGALMELTKEQYEAIMAGPCEFCGATEGLTLAHDNPVSQGGTTTIDNCFCLCRSCKSRMNTKTLRGSVATDGD